MSTRASRVSTSAFDEIGAPCVRSVAKNVLPSCANVTPQKLKSRLKNGAPSRVTFQLSSSPIAVPPIVSTMVVRVENTPSAYECPRRRR